MNFIFLMDVYVYFLMTSVWYVVGWYLAHVIVVTQSKTGAGGRNYQIFIVRLHSWLARLLLLLLLLLILIIIIIFCSSDFLQTETDSNNIFYPEPTL